jgi:hypothetical protein
MKLVNLAKLLLIGASLTAGSAFAVPNTLTVTRNGFDGVPDAKGGEFVVTTSNNGTFLSFCLERHVDVNPDGTTVYAYTVTDSIALGGGQDLTDAGVGDPVSKGTAWLYKRFANGTLVDSDGVGNYNDRRDTNAGELQKAIWALEDEVDYVGYTNYYVDLVQGIFGGNAGAASTDGSVLALNLWGVRDQKDVQSMLYTVPDGAMTSVLLGLGLMSLALFRRKQ